MDHVGGGRMADQCIEGGGASGKDVRTREQPPDRMRFGFPALYTRYVDAFDAVEVLADVLDSGEWQDARFDALGMVT